MEKRNQNEKTAMSGREPNRAIACTVSECAHHAKSCDFCALDRIRVGAHEPHPTETRCVDCESFACDPASCGRTDTAREI